MRMITSDAGLRAVVSELERAACAGCRNSSASQESVRATLRMFSPLLPVAQRRVEAYFSGCLKRASMRRGGVESARLILASVAADLREAGRTPSDIWDELVRGWSDTVPESVLEEYRVTLLASVA